MYNPFEINEPFCISFSGGRSSAYMLHRMLDAFGGKPPDHGKVVFANTGREMPATLDFVRDCADRWDVPITWVEYGGREQVGIHEKGRWKGKPIYKAKTNIVNHATASRDGEPFAMLIKERKMPPNWQARFCTSELKVFRIHNALDDWGHPKALQVIGIRGDEPRRAVKIHNSIDKNGVERYCPLWVSKVTKEDVLQFWTDHPFDLDLPHSGDFSNCDLCFLKGKGVKVRILQERPDLADWWVDQEIITTDASSAKQVWFSNRHSYSDLQEIAKEKNTEILDDYSTLPCVCSD